MANDDFDFDRATRRALFGKNHESKIPGHGRSATENAIKHAKVKVTMNFDGDVVAFFKARAKTEGRSYQILINDALREYIRGNSAEQIAKAVGNMLLDDQSFHKQLAQKLSESPNEEEE